MRRLRHVGTSSDNLSAVVCANFRDSLLLEAPFHTHFHKNLCGYFLYRKMGRVDIRNILPAEQALDFAHFEFALGKTRVTAVGLAFMADGRKPIRVDGKPEQLVPMST